MLKIGRRLCLALVVIALAAFAGAGPASASTFPAPREAQMAEFAMPFAGAASTADDVGRAASRNPEALSFLAILLPIIGAIALALVGYALIQWYLEEQRKK